MTKLRGLVFGMAAALRVPEKTVMNTASVLRRHKMLTTGPRGPGAPEMTPTDATNLLLALMYDEQAEDAAVNVPRLRSATFYGSTIVGSGAEDHDQNGLPEHQFLTENDLPRTFGNVLDNMFHEAVIYGGFDDEDDDGARAIYLVNLNIRISRPGYLASLYMDTYRTLWTLKYSWKDPADNVQPGRGTSPRLLPTDLRGPFMSSSRSIADASFYEIVDCLRGRSMDDNEFECIPPYNYEIG